jgi:putative transposase
MLRSAPKARVSKHEATSSFETPRFARLLRGWPKTGEWFQRDVIPSVLRESREVDMSWTGTTREHYRREGLRFASDTRDVEWALLEPLMPQPAGVGRPREVKLRAIVDAILYLLWTGCPWRALPPVFPARSTVQGYFYRWRDDGTYHVINRVLRERMRQAIGRKAAPSACVIDSQSVRTTESGGPRGFDAAKRIKGRKRHIVTDTQGWLLDALVQPANIQDNHGAVPLLRMIGQRFPRLRHVFADRVYRGPRLLNALADLGPWTIEIVTRKQSLGTFKPEPRRWVVERTFAWLGRNRRLAKDYERTIASETAWLLLASIRLLTRRLARA